MADRFDAAEAIRSLIFRYAEALDTGRFDIFSELFETGRLVLPSAGQEATGPTEVRTLLEQGLMLYDGVPGTMHFNTNTLIDVDPSLDRASARTYFCVLQAVPGLPLQPIVTGRYLDRFTADDGQWRFEERQILIDLAGDLSCHLKD